MFNLLYYIYIYIYVFLSVRFHSDSSIRRSVENVLSLNQEHTLNWMNTFLDPHTSLKQGLGLINQGWV